MPVVAVRRADASDAVALSTLHRALWPDDDAASSELARLLARDDFAAFLAVADGRPVAFAEASLRHYVDGAPDAVNGYLEGLFVAADHRRAGIATRLLDAVAAWARAAGATDLGSDTDLDNPDGAAWHGATGFAEVGRTINFVRPL